MIEIAFGSPSYRYLLIRDVDNVSGVWDLKTSIEKEFLIPFRKAIDLSKAHYELELKQVPHRNLSWGCPLIHSLFRSLRFQEVMQSRININ